MCMCLWTHNSLWPFFLASAYTEAYNVCLVAVPPPPASVGDVGEETMGDEDQGRTSEEEEGGADGNYERQVRIFQNQNPCVKFCQSVRLEPKVALICFLIWAVIL